VLPWILAALVLATVARLRRAGTLAVADRRYAERFPPHADGIASGAESFAIDAGTGCALLLLHGSGDSPQTLRYLGRRLQAAGYTVHAPLLPGHGRSPGSFADVQAPRYRQAAEDALDVLRRDASWIGVVGLSMGGAIAAQLAATESDVRALVLLAPYLEPPASVRWVARTSALWGAIVPYLNGRGEGSVHDVSARAESRAYGLFTPAALRALVATAAAGQRALPHVTVPTLVVHSREDIRIPTAIAERASAGLRAPTERRWVSGCGHVITVDYCKQAVADLVIDFLAPLTPLAAR
jgi:carboxylesterase